MPSQTELGTEKGQLYLLFENKKLVSADAIVHKTILAIKPTRTETSKEWCSVAMK